MSTLPPSSSFFHSLFLSLSPPPSLSLPPSLLPPSSLSPPSLPPSLPLSLSLSLSSGGELVNIVNTQSLSPRQVLRVFYETCQAVAHMHSQTPPIIHRDIKVSQTCTCIPTTHIIHVCMNENFFAFLLFLCVG